MSGLSPDRREDLRESIWRAGQRPAAAAHLADALAPLIAEWLDDTYRRALADAYPLAAAEREAGAAEALRQVADGIESQSPEMSFTDASLYFRFADFLRTRAAAIGGE